MDVRLLISASRDLVLSFLLRDGSIEEIKVEGRESRRLAGSIFKGKVKRLVKSLSGAFLDIGLDREAYLLLKGYEGEGCHPPKVGTELIVQIKREAIEDKGAKVTCRISLPGKYIVYLPNTAGVFISGRIGEGEKRERFKGLFQGLLNGDGVIIRTSAKLASDKELVQELERLRERWKTIVELARKRGVGLLYEEVPQYAQLIRDHWSEISEIVVDDRDIWTELLGFLEEDYPHLLRRVRYVKNVSVFMKKYNLDGALDKLFSKYVWLKGGGFIIIEETETMTVVDVNSGTGWGNNLEENALKTNLEAAQEIARQIKLRGIGGIIVIDFIDMKDRENREALVRKMKELFADEGSRVHIYGITNLGLLEMTRKKETPSVTRLLSSRCPHCKGRGLVKRKELVLYELEKDISYYRGRYLEVRLNPSLRSMVEELVKKKKMEQWVSVREEWNAPLDYYEIFLKG